MGGELDPRLLDALRRAAARTEVDGRAQAVAPAREREHAPGRARAEMRAQAGTPARTREQLTVRETHSSFVVLAGDLAYKIKKSVRFDFLDYSTLELRRRACLEEVRVNTALAPEIYRGVRAIVPDPEGEGDGACVLIAAAEHPGAVEYVVEMARFREADTLAGAIADGSLATRDLHAVGAALARFHRDAAPATTGGGPETVLDQWRRNLAELAEAAAQAWPPQSPGWSLLRIAERFGAAFVARHAEEMRRRQLTGHVRDGHGDLRCEHVLIRPAVRLLDRIEFDPSLRRGDVAAEIAFLTMDLRLRRRARAADELLAAYRRAGGSPGSEELRSFYAVHRALVRAKVTLIGAGSRRGALAEAERLMDLAERLMWRARRPLAIAVCGPAASGKSTLAAALSARAQLPVISSDVVRKRLFGLQPTERGRPEHYSRQATHATYDALSRQALSELRLHGGVIVDATLRTRAQRAILMRRLAPARTPLLFVQCEVPAEVALRWAAARVARAARAAEAAGDVASESVAHMAGGDVARAARPSQEPSQATGPPAADAARAAVQPDASAAGAPPVSDATAAVVAAQRREFQPLRELPPGMVLRLDCRLSMQTQVGEVAEALDRRIAAVERESVLCHRDLAPLHGRRSQPRK